MAFNDEYINRAEAIIAVTNDGCTANVVGVLYHLPSSDVVPKSEVDKIENAYNRAIRKVNKNAITAIQKANQEVAREIFEEIEKYCRPPIPEAEPIYLMHKNEFAELKKKYTEGDDEN